MTVLRHAWPLVLVVGCAAAGDDPGPSIGRTSQAVTHGEPDTEHEATVRVPLAFETCSATFISPRVAVTAAHCVLDGSPEVVVGRDGARASVRAAVMMPGFDGKTLERDLAVLVVDAPIVAPTTLSDGPAVGDDVTIVGYGRTESHDLRVGVRYVGIGVVEQTSAQAFATTAGPSQPCAGDSGGAAFIRRGDREVLVGVVSHGDAGCERRAHFTRVDGDARAFVDAFVERDHAGADPVPAGDDRGCSTSHGRPSPTSWLLALLAVFALRAASRPRRDLPQTRT